MFLNQGDADRNPLPAGTAAPALVFEEHVAFLADRNSEVERIVSQTASVARLRFVVRSRLQDEGAVLATLEGAWSFYVRGSVAAA